MTPTSTRRLNHRPAGGGAPPTAPAVVDAAVRAKFTAARAEMDAKLIERGDDIDVLLTALAAGQNPLFVGPPGTAKSHMVRAISQWLDGRYFELVLDKFTDPAQLFGPIDVAAMMQERVYQRVLDGSLAEADVAFLDEFFKGSTAIQNTMLPVLNERTLRQGRKVIALPLQMAVAASNEYPQGEELGALFDRFLLRKQVLPIGSPDGRERLLRSRPGDFQIHFSTRITPAEIQIARQDALGLEITEPAFDALLRILHELAAEGVQPGDRRSFLSTTVARAYAYVLGADRVEPEHLEILAHTLWVDPSPDQREKVAEVVSKVANPTIVVVRTRLAEARDVMAKTTPSNLTQAMSAVDKLDEIVTALSTLKGDAARRACDTVAGMCDKLRAACMRSRTRANP